jgi:hypothetical protein
MESSLCNLCNIEEVTLLLVFFSEFLGKIKFKKI